MRILLGIIVKFLTLAHFSVDHFPHPVRFSLYYLWVCLQIFFIMWLIIFPVTTYPTLDILLHIIDFWFKRIGPYCVVLCYYKKIFHFSLFFLLPFPGLSREILPSFRLENPYSFSSYFRFLDFLVILFVLMLSVQLLTSLNTLSLLFFIKSLSPRNDAFTISSMQAILLSPLFLIQIFDVFSWM